MVGQGLVVHCQLLLVLRVELRLLVGLRVALADSTDQTAPDRTNGRAEFLSYPFAR